MATDPDRYSGCLLGMAVGDALGATVDKKTYAEICRDYGPDGLLGYDLVNGFAEISSYTQVAAYAVNALLVAVSRGRTEASDLMAHITQALKEWARAQHLPGAPEQRICWLHQAPQLRQRKCMDPRTLDSLTREVLGTPERPANSGTGPGSLTAAVSVGMFFTPERMSVHQVGTLGAQTVALTHGDPSTFLSGAVLAYAIAGILQEPSVPLQNHFVHAAEAVVNQFGKRFPQAADLAGLLKEAIDLALEPGQDHVQIMERIRCDTAARVLAGAMYASIAGNSDLDTALIIAVNHSGKSAGVGAVTGALLGAHLGEAALPEFYLESLNGAHILRELASDLDNSGPKGWRSRLFDHEWDRKYNHSLPKG